MINCPFCYSLHIKRHGILFSWAQRFLCKICKKSFSCGWKRSTYNKEFKNHIIENYCHQHETAKKVVETYKISTATLIKRSKEHKKNCTVCK